MFKWKRRRKRPSAVERLDAIVKERVRRETWHQLRLVKIKLDGLLSRTKDTTLRLEELIGYCSAFRPETDDEKDGMA